MAKGYTWPTDDEVVKGIAEVGSRTAYARNLGVGQSTLSQHISRRPKLKTRVDKALEKAHALHAKKLVPTGEVSQEELLLAEVAELRSGAKRDRKGEVERERLARSIEDALGVVAPPDRVGPATIKPRNPEAHHRQLVAFSDWHGGEVVDPDAVNGLNEY